MLKLDSDASVGFKYSPKINLNNENEWILKEVRRNHTYIERILKTMNTKISFLYSAKVFLCGLLN